jgi:hypothetical protein
MIESLRELITRLGEKRALQILQEAEGHSSAETLTIIANEGVHHLPDSMKRGHVHVASHGNLDFSTISTVQTEYSRILSDLAHLLKQRTWKRIYLVPFGPSTLSMQIKLLVYRITRIETADVFYDGKGNYFDLFIAQRDLIIEAEQSYTNGRGF